MSDDTSRFEKIATEMSDIHERLRVLGEERRDIVLRLGSAGVDFANTDPNYGQIWPWYRAASKFEREAFHVESGRMGRGSFLCLGCGCPNDFGCVVCPSCQT